MTSVYVSEFAANNAEKIQQTHKADEDGWCGFCLTHFRIRVKAGWCKPWQLAQGFINAYELQRKRLESHRPPVPRMEFTRPGGRVWPIET